MGTAFDQALENHALLEAAEHYALQRGGPRSPEYRAAWIRFRSQIRTIDDLNRWRTHQRLSMRIPRQRATPSVSRPALAIETTLQPAASTSSMTPPPTCPARSWRFGAPAAAVGGSVSGAEGAGRVPTNRLLRA